MGVDAWVQVRTQITDEKQWQKAMQAVKMHFKNDKNFCEWKWDKFNYHEKTANLSKDEILGLFMTENDNFGKDCNMYQWESYSFLLKNTITSHEDLIEFEKNMCKECNGKGSHELKEARRALVALEELTETEKERFFQLPKEGDSNETLYVSPPTMFEFTVGEHPRLPVFGRHFRYCESKVSGSCHVADEYLQQIHDILKDFFPGNIYYTEEDYNADRPVKEDDDKSSKRHFYDSLVEVVPLIQTGTLMSDVHRIFLEKRKY